MKLQPSDLDSMSDEFLEARRYQDALDREAIELESEPPEVPLWQVLLADLVISVAAMGWFYFLLARGL